MTVFPRASSIRSHPPRQRSVGGRDYHDRDGVVEERVVPQCKADIDSSQLVELLVEHQDIIAAASGQLERLLARASTRDVVSLLCENALQRTAHPFIVASDQSYWAWQSRLGH